MNPLTTIPPTVRTALYWIGYVIGVLGQGITIVWGSIAAASPDISMPVGLVIASAVLGLLQTQLNLLAGSNVPAEVEQFEAVLGEVEYVQQPVEVKIDGADIMRALRAEQRRHGGLGIN